MIAARRDNGNAGNAARLPPVPAWGTGRARSPLTGAPEDGTMQLEGTTIYLAPRGFEEDLGRELSNVVEQRGRLFIAEGPPQNPVWAQNTWLAPVAVPVESIADGARRLKAMQRNWWLHSTGFHRRARLIQDKLPHVSAKPLVFGTRPPEAPLGSWTLWEENLIIASSACTSPFPDGEVVFEENKTVPPTRAYLKLWELFTLLTVRPRPGELCLDLGSSPGGWSWVLAEMGARVFSIDKSPLADHIAAHPNINWCGGSAFGLDPRHAGAVDWLFSDVICYPERLLEMVHRWLEHGTCRNFVCTIKLQGQGDMDVVRQFAAIEGSRVMHLSANKHELTWVKLG